ncbi:MAG: CPBP family intramembrane metalloprotease [Candidatus Dormibacteraeota bacterium]|nr:CPBP family intramembrane metalloprotease [Candidatus Dormibacteraeota bacterium]
MSAVLLAAVASRALLQDAVGEPAAGLVFALLLLGVAVVARPEVGSAGPRAISAGIAVGVALLVPGLWLKFAGLPPRAWFVEPQALLLYSGALLLIAPAEELFLRGVLQPAFRSALGPGPAIVVTALLFAAIHVPAYGPAAVPLDLGVGIVLGWLRERTGSTASCALAHLVADLGAWWLP